MIGKLYTQHRNYVRLDILRKRSVWFANYRTGISSACGSKKTN